MLQCYNTIYFCCIIWGFLTGLLNNCCALSIFVTPDWMTVIGHFKSDLTV